MIRVVSQFLMLMFFPISMSAQYSMEKAIKYTVDEGLPSSTCYDVEQDSDGYIWIATEGGLAKFNGTTFKTYSVKDGLPNNEIVKIIFDNDDRLWLNCTDSVIYFQNEEVTAINSSLVLNLNRNFDVLQNDKNELWIGIFNRVRLIDLDNGNEKDISDYDLNLKSKINLTGYYKDTLYILDDFKVSKVYKNRVVDTIPLPNPLKTEHWINKSSFLNWPYIVHTNNHEVYKFNLETHQEEKIYESTKMIKNVELHGRNIFTLTNNSLVKMSTDEDLNILKIDTLVDNIITSSFFLDKEENIWLAAYKSGLFFIPKQNSAIEIYDCSEFGENHLESIVIKGDEIIAGTDDNKLIRIKNNQIQEQPLNLPLRGEINRTLDLYPLENNSILLSTDSGISVLDSNKHNHILSSSSKRLFINDSVFVATTFSRSYTGKLSDLLDNSSLLSQSAQILNFSKVLVTNRVFSAIQDSRGSYWIGDEKEGLTKIHASDTTYYRDLSNIFETSITRIIEIDNGKIAMSTNGQGLIIISGDQFLQIDSEHGLSSDICYNLKYSDNKLLVSTNRGLSIISNLDFANRKYNVEILNKDDGLPTNEILAADSNDSIIALATNAGIATIELNNFKKFKTAKKVIIEDFEVNNLRVATNENLVLESNQNNIRINYVVPEFKRSTKHIYSYMLEGLHDTWINTTSMESNYSNLEPGSYNFKVKLDNVGEQSLTNFAFEIKPQFQETVLFRWLMAIGSLLLLFTLFSFWNNKRQKDLLKQLVGKKTVELQSKMDDLSVLNKKLSASNLELEQFAYIASHDLQEPINSITGFSKILESKAAQKGDPELKQFTSMITGSADRMKELIKDILSYSRIGVDKKFINIDCNKIINDIESDLSKKISDTNTVIVYKNLPTIVGLKIELRLLFQNLISNAIKFQKKGQQPKIEIKCTSDSNHYIFSISDNGIGIKPEFQKQIFNIFQRLHNREEYAGTGIGLAHCKKIIDLHNGEIWVESEYGSGSVFNFTIAKALVKS